MRSLNSWTRSGRFRSPSPWACLSAATCTITVSGNSSPVSFEARVILLYVAGHKVATTIGASDTVDEIATAIAAAVNDDDDLPVTASATRRRP